MQPQVRVAKPEDFVFIVGMAERLHEENGHLEIDRELAENALMGAINQDKAIIGLIGPTEDIQGIVFLRLCQFWYSKQIILEEMFLYVKPEHRRGTGIPASLVKWAVAAGKRLEVPLMIGVLSNQRTRAKLRLYRRFIGHPVGGYFFIMPNGAMRI